MVNRPRQHSAEVFIADEEISTFEFDRSRTHQLSDFSWSEKEGDDARQETQALWDIAMEGEVTSELFLDNPFARTATLGILRLHGDWEAADAMQEKIAGDTSPWRKDPLNGRVLDSSEEEAERITRVEWGMVSVSGLTMLVRRRKLLAVDNWVHEGKIITNRGRNFNAYSKFEVDKISTFALDIRKLDEIDPRAAREIRMIIICGMIATSDTDKIKRAVTHTPTLDDTPEDVAEQLGTVMFAREKMREYAISAEAIAYRLTKRDQYPERIQRQPTIAAIENEIKNPNGLLIPSTVTFYGTRTPHTKQAG